MMQIPALAVHVAAEATRDHSHSALPHAPVVARVAGAPDRPARTAIEAVRGPGPVRHVTATLLRRLADRLDVPVAST